VPGALTRGLFPQRYPRRLRALVHRATGTKHRLDRDQSGRFSSESDATEELVAELGAAFLCAEHGITLEPRLDHAQYLTSWLSVLKADQKAIFAAASAASKAVEFLSAKKYQIRAHREEPNATLDCVASPSRLAMISKIVQEGTGRNAYW